MFKARVRLLEKSNNNTKVLYEMSKARANYMNEITDQVIKQNSEVSAEFKIKRHIQCYQCVQSLPQGESIFNHTKLSIGFTDLGIQVWCKIHDVNVCNIDFEDRVHPANRTNRTTYTKPRQIDITADNKIFDISRKRIEQLANLPDEDIDLLDIPAIADTFWEKRRLVNINAMQNESRFTDNHINYINIKGALEEDMNKNKKVIGTREIIRRGQRFIVEILANGKYGKWLKDSSVKPTLPNSKQSVNNSEASVPKEILELSEKVEDKKPTSNPYDVLSVLAEFEEEQKRLKKENRKVKSEK